MRAGLDPSASQNGRQRSPKSDARLWCKYNSYAGEITPSVPNLLARDFAAEAPNQKWVTDITEFSIQAGKIYLSPIIDCFDGQITSWPIGTKPNAELVNTMLAAAAKGLPSGSQPIVHSDRGAHYRWPGWIELISRYELTRSMSKRAALLTMHRRRASSVT